MYANRGRRRTHVIKVRLNNREYEMLQILVKRTGDQKAVLLREKAFEKIMCEMK